MADRRPNGTESRAKRQKTDAEMDPKANPYLAHMYEDNNYSNGSSASTGLAKLVRHKTTCQDAKVAEDGPSNPFTGNQLSKRYFDILRVRRDLPVHAQRQVSHLRLRLCLPTNRSQR